MIFKQMKKITWSLLYGFFFLAGHYNDLSAATWSSPPTDVSASTGVADSSQVATNASGYSVAIWRQGGAVSVEIQAATSPINTTSWSAPATIDSGNPSSPDIAVDPAGNAVAIWKQASPLSSSIKASTLPFGGTWTAPVIVQTGGGPLAFTTPHVGVDAGGNAVAIWSNDTGAAGQIHIESATLPFGGSWTVPVTLELGDNATPQIGVDASGNAVAVWTNTTLGITTVHAATFIGGIWSSPTTISIVGDNATTPEIAVNAAGNAIAVWEDTTTGLINAATLPFGGAWSSVSVLSAAGQIASNPQIAIDPAGNGVAVWQRFNGINLEIQASTLIPFGGTWSPAVMISQAGMNAFSPDVGVDASGDAVAVWASSISFGNSVIQAAFLPFSGTWSSPPDTISLMPGSATNPHVGVDALGNAVAVWNFSIMFPNSIVQASKLIRFVPPPPPTPPSNLGGQVLKNRFATQTDRVHRLTWQPSQDPSVIGYHVYRNGQLIATIPASGPFIYDDHNRRKRVADVYVVTAFNAAGMESAILTVTLR